MLVLSAAGFYATEMLLSRVVFFEGDWAVWWPINGIALGVLLAARRRHWWWILTALAVGVAFAEPGDTPGEMLAVGVSNAIEVWLPALALPRFRTMDRWLSQPGTAWRFILLAMVAAPASSALLGAFYTHGRQGASYWATVLRWGASDELGTGLSTPLVLALLSPEMWQLFRPAALPKTLGLIAIMAASSWLLFHQNKFPIAFIVYPLVLLLGTELGLSGAVIGVNLLAFIATAATLLGAGPFGASLGDQPMTRVLVLQLFLALSISMTLPVSVARVRRLTTEAQLRRAWLKMEALAQVDGLTGVANRRRFDTALGIEWARGRRDGSPLALLMIDVDRFKAFNDNYGHLAGDACLRSIALAIASVPARPGDLAARYGGEEFALLLPGSDLAGAQMIAETVRRAVYGLALPHLVNESQRVTVSIGLASTTPSIAGEAIDLIAVSDKALYEAKNNGRNQVRAAQEGEAKQSSGGAFAPH